MSRIKNYSPLQALINPPIKIKITISPIRFSDRLPLMVEYFPLCLRFEKIPLMNIIKNIGTPKITDIKTKPSIKGLHPVNPNNDMRYSRCAVFLFMLFNCTYRIRQLFRSQLHLNSINYAH
jgi:hypothetical protein